MVVREGSHCKPDYSWKLKALCQGPVTLMIFVKIVKAAQGKDREKVPKKTTLYFQPAETNA